MKAMKKSRLLKSILVMTVFYWTVLTGVFSFFTPPRVHDAMLRLPEALRSALPPLTPLDQANAAFHSGEYQWALIQVWTGPVLALWMLFVLFGMFCGLAISWKKGWEYQWRAKADDPFRGLKITVGTLPLPIIPERVDTDVELTSVKFTRAEKDLLNAIMGTLGARKDAYCGDGHGVGVYEHSVNVIREALENEDVDANLVLTAAAHDLGKLTSFRKRSNGEWESIRLHSNESARILAGMPEWWELEPLQREAIRLAVKFDHAPEKLPHLRHPLGATDLARELIFRLRKVDGEATRQEKEVIKEKMGDLPTMAVQAFVDALPQMAFHTRGTPKGSTTCGLKKGNRLYIFEPFMREFVMGRMTPDEAAALGGDYRKQGQAAEFTHHLLKGLYQEKWLVTREECRETENSDPRMVEMQWYSAFWDIKSGKADKNGVIIVDLPEDVVGRLPKGDSWYDIRILRGRKTDVRRAIKNGKGAKGGKPGKGAKSSPNPPKGNGANPAEKKPRSKQAEGLRLDRSQVDAAKVQTPPTQTTEEAPFQDVANDDLESELLDQGGSQPARSVPDKPGAEPPRKDPGAATAPAEGEERPPRAKERKEKVYHTKKKPEKRHEAPVPAPEKPPEAATPKPDSENPSGRPKAGTSRPPRAGQPDASPLKNQLLSD